MGNVVSRDGTRIAFDRLGNGRPVILVDGALGYREQWGSRPLASLLSRRFTVYTYDRRGRGESADTQPYAVEREIEDVEALVGAAGGSAYLFGSSSGAVLALKAAGGLGTEKVVKLALYEPPLELGEDAKDGFAQYAAQTSALLAAGKRDDALALFLADMLPPETLDAMKQSPEWPALKAVAHTLAYDNAIMGDGTVPTADAKAAAMPVMVMDGEKSFEPIRKAADALAELMPNARRLTLATQTHAASPDALAPILIEFFDN